MGDEVHTLYYFNSFFGRGAAVHRCNTPGAVTGHERFGKRSVALDLLIARTKLMSALGQKAKNPPRAKPHRCPLWTESGQIRQRSFCALSARSRHQIKKRPPTEAASIASSVKETI
jgi:hypothetical protein